MRGLACTLIVAVALAGLVLADDPPEAASVDPLEQFQRDQALIRNLVEGGLQLAGEDDPLARAQTCTTLAGQLSREIKQAADNHDGPRAAFLANHLEALLIRGVASNAGRVRKTAPDGRDVRRTKTLEALVVGMDQATEPAEQGLKQLATAVNDFRILRPLEHGRASVQRAVHGDAGGVVPSTKK